MFGITLLVPKCWGTGRASHRISKEVKIARRTSGLHASAWVQVLALLLYQLPAKAPPSHGTQPMMATELGSLPPTWEPKVEFKAPGFKCGQFQLLFEEMNQDVEDLSLSRFLFFLFLCLSNKYKEIMCGKLNHSSLHLIHSFTFQVS